VREAFDEVFGKPDAANSFSPHWFAGRNDMWILREIALAAGITANDYEVGYSRLESAYLARLRKNLPGWKGSRVLPGVPELLAALHGPVPLGIVTGNLEEGARIKLSNFGLDRYFPAGGYGSDAIERAEITRLAHQRFERRLGRAIAPDAVLVIGDTIHDVAAARSCGFRVAAVASGTTSAGDLAAAGPDLLLPDLSDPAPILRLAGLAPIIAGP
jgi:phosphoglycolate phosphatase-like HAD superfamily hydrolase